jgi:peptidoglycan/LPS O-acetylase OafA/YrhL
VRRILPALFAMLAVITAASAILLFPQMLSNYALSLLATVGFVSNFHFFGNTGYWAPAAAEQPLIHTWSLAIEEQFYLLFPPLLLLFRRSSRTTVLIGLTGLLLLSLAISIVSVRYAPTAAFYLLPSRFWELLVGSVLAIGAWQPPQSPVLRNILAVLGIALIACAVFALSSASPFPGVNAIPPCLGAALIIYAGSDKSQTMRAPFANALLATRVPVAVGLISYSLYLWHWPIFVLATAVLPHGLNSVQTILAIVGSVALAVLSWRFVEQPFRGHGSRVPRQRLFILAGGAIVVLALVAGVFAAAKGLPQRYDIQTQKILAEANDEPMRAHCFNRSGAKIAKEGLCKIGAPNAAPTFLLWGDSHADAIVPAISDAATADGKSGFVGAHGHCAPFADVSQADPTCAPFNKAVMKIVARPEIRTIFLDARWAVYAGVPSMEGLAPAESNADIPNVANTAQSRADFQSMLTHTVTMLTAMGKKVVIIGPVPEFRHSVPNDIAKMRVWHESLNIATTRKEYLAREKFVYSVLQQLAALPRVVVVWPDRSVCPAAQCATSAEGLPLYRDSNHLSVYGAHTLTPLFTGLF